MTDRRPLRILLPLLGLATALLVAGCPDDSDDTRTPSRDAGATATKESCIAAGRADLPIECPEGCDEIGGRTATACVPGETEPSTVVGCTIVEGGVLPAVGCFVRPGSPDVYAVTDSTYLDMDELGWQPCEEQAPACEP
jgi:hypothetical protein